MRATRLLLGAMLLVLLVSAAALAAPGTISKPGRGLTQPVFWGEIAGATGSGSSLAPGSSSVNGSCKNNETAVGAGFKSLPRNVNVTGFGPASGGQWQLTAANFGPNPARVGLACSVWGGSWG